MRLSHDAVVTDYRMNGYIAHAFGEINGAWYTNSLDAFRKSYAAGFRLFEADMMLLADGTAAAVHDGEEKRYGLTKKFHEATWAEVRDLRYLPAGSDVFPILDARQIAVLLASHPDARLVLDGKATKSVTEYLVLLERLTEAAPRSVLERVYPHVTGNEVESARSIFPWSDVMLALYRTQWQGRMEDDEVVDFVEANGIGGVMMWRKPRDFSMSLAENGKRHQRFTPKFARRLQALGAAVFVHGIQAEDQISAFCEMSVGVYSKGWIA